jgi:hypothetical protein
MNAEEEEEVNLSEDDQVNHPLTTPLEAKSKKVQEEEEDEEEEEEVEKKEAKEEEEEEEEEERLGQNPLATFPGLTNNLLHILHEATGHAKLAAAETFLKIPLHPSINKHLCQYMIPLKRLNKNGGFDLQSIQESIEFAQKKMGNFLVNWNAGKFSGLKWCYPVDEFSKIVTRTWIFDTGKKSLPDLFEHDTIEISHPLFHSHQLFGLAEPSPSRTTKRIVPLRIALKAVHCFSFPNKMPFNLMGLDLVQLSSKNKEISWTPEPRCFAVPPPPPPLTSLNIGKENKQQKSMIDTLVTSRQPPSRGSANDPVLVGSCFGSIFPIQPTFSTANRDNPDVLFLADEDKWSHGDSSRFWATVSNLLDEKKWLEFVTFPQSSTEAIVPFREVDPGRLNNPVATFLFHYKRRSKGSPKIKVTSTKQDEYEIRCDATELKGFIQAVKCKYARPSTIDLTHPDSGHLAVRLTPLLQLPRGSTSSKEFWTNFQSNLVDRPQVGISIELEIVAWT